MKIPFQTKKQKEVVNRVMERFERMKISRKDHGDGQWDTWDQLYLNISTRNPTEDWMANVFVPFVMSTVLAILSEITSRRTRWKLRPVTQEDEPKIGILTAITEFTMEKGHFDDESFSRDMDKLIYGTAVWKEIYREDKQKIRTRKIDKDGVETIDEKDIKGFNDVYGKHIPLRNFYLDDKAKSMRDARDSIEINILDISDFKMQYSKFESSKKVKKWGFLKPTASDKTIQNIPIGASMVIEGVFTPTGKLRDNEVEVIEYYSKSKDEHIIIANGFLVVEEPNAYDHKQLPYAVDICIPRPNSWTGIGVPELLYPIQEEMNTTHNQMIDENKISIHPPIIASGMAILDEEEYELKPGKIIQVEDGNAVQLQMRGVTDGAFRMLEELKQTARVASGLDVRFAEGIAPKGNNTATEITQLQEASLRRIGLITKILEIRCLPRIGMLRTANIQQFYKDPLKVEAIVSDGSQLGLNEDTGNFELKHDTRIIRIPKEGGGGYEFVNVKPEDIRANVDVFVEPQSTQPFSKAVLVKRLNTALQTVMSFPPALQIVDITALFKAFFKELDLPSAIVRDVLNIDKEESYQLAEAENQMMATGDKIPGTKNPSVEHTLVHSAYVYEMTPDGQVTGKINEHFQGLPSKAKEAFYAHIKTEQETHALKGNITMDKARTPNLGGTGTQTTVAGSETNQAGVGL